MVMAMARDREPVACPSEGKQSKSALQLELGPIGSKLQLVDILSQEVVFIDRGLYLPLEYLHRYQRFHDQQP